MIPAPFWPLDDLATRWREPLDVVKGRAEVGQFNLSTMDIDGEPRAGITADELRRFESQPGDALMRADAKRSYLEAVAMLLAHSFGSDPAILRSHTTEKELERFADLAGIPLSRCTRTYVEIFKAGAAILRQCGYLKAESEQPQTAEDISPTSQRAAA